MKTVARDTPAIRIQIGAEPVPCPLGDVAQQQPFASWSLSPQATSV